MGERVARALEAHVERLVEDELLRLQKKIAAAGPAYRAEVERVTRQVVVALAAQIAAALERTEEPELVDLVARLFRLSV